MSWFRSRSVALLLVVLAVSVGCAQEREPINRVQADVVSKAFFVGDDLVDPADNPEFWTQATLIDVGYGTQGYLLRSTFTMAPARIKWEITEDLLLGRLAYERIDDTDGKGIGGPTPDGQLVVAYPIKSHFDIRRAYNPSTGEELNVIEENQSDRPWYLREYMRVDWSKNLNTDAYDFDTLSLLGVYGGTTYSPLAYQVTDPSHEHAPHFAPEDGYFDVTNKAFAVPELVDLSHLGWGIEKFPACFLPNDLLGGTEPYGNCNPTEVTIRQGFRRVEDTDYEPVDWDGFRFQAYGAFLKQRWGMERNYGMSDEKWRRFLTRYNIWERSHYYDDPEAMTGPVECYTPETNAAFDDDPNRDEDEDGTADQCWTVAVKLAQAAGECEGLDEQACYQLAKGPYGGSQCDSFKQKCTLPLRHRTLKPLAWYLSERSNIKYWDGTYWAAHDHDVAMRHAAQASRYVECMTTIDAGVDYESAKEQCVAENPVYFGQMDDHLEADQLAAEVDDCRNGRSYVGTRNQADYGPINSAEREEQCVALADQVAAARGLDGWEDTDPHRVAGLVHLAKMPQQIVLCHSPVEADDPAACAPPELRLPAGVTMADCQTALKTGDREMMSSCRSARYARIGDLRYHVVNVFEEPQAPSFWGIYSDAEDPLTGETFAASINVWSHVNDYVSQIVVDRIRYAKGEISTAEVTEGQYVKDWVLASEAGGMTGMNGRFTREAVDGRVAAAVGVEREQLAELRQHTDPKLKEQVRHVLSHLSSIKAKQGEPSTTAPIYEARRQALLGTEMEAELADPMMQHLGGVEAVGLNEATMKFASPLRMLNPRLRKQLRNQLEVGLAERGMCVLQDAPAPASLTGLADVLERKFSGQWGDLGSGDPSGELSDKKWALRRAEAMQAYLANRLHRSVVGHEMGHSVGMRHNFVGSSDAFSYRPQYWQLRTKNGTVLEECTDRAEDGTACTGPRWFDPVDQEERDSLIWMWMHSTAMEYPGEFSQDLLGLGGWDYAAHRSFYGDTVAVFDDESYQHGENRADWLVFKMDNFGGLIGFQPEITIMSASEGIGPVDIHYSQLQKHYELIKHCQEVDAEQWKPASWDAATQGVWDPVIDGMIVKANGAYSKCRQQPVDYVSWRQLRFPTMRELKDSKHTSYEPYFRGGPLIDPQERLRVPYGFATDRWADIGNAAVYRHDNGADSYEIFNFYITQQEVDHIFDNYRRGRQTFSVRSASNRTLGRFNEKIRDGAKGLGLQKQYFVDVAEELSLTHSSLWAYAAANWFPDQVLASGMVFDHFTRMFARPEPGDHLRDVSSSGDLILRAADDDTLLDGDPAVTIPNGAGGYLDTMSFGGKLIENRLCEIDFDPEGNPFGGCGEYDADFTMNAGSYYDKAWTGYLMSESEDNYISDSRTDFTDGRYRAYSMADLFPDGYRRFVANYLTGDTDVTSLYVAGDDTGNPLVEIVEGSNGATYRWPSVPLGTVSWWAEDPEICFPGPGTTVCNTYDTYTSHITEFDPHAPATAIKLDPQVGWGQQKFLIAYTLLYLPSSERRHWLDMMRLWRMGVEADPDIPEEARIEWHNPEGETFVARRFGTEELFGKTVERGIAARMLEYANSLMEPAYEGAWNAAGTTYVPAINPATGDFIVKYDPNMGPQGTPVNTEHCNWQDNTGCRCEDNHACLVLQKWATVPYYMWEVATQIYYGDPETRGIYD
ncbi:MAG: hypothetical protein JRI23_29065 [Deltaproteobacteria bacterium]|jgi:hypothetical protein|nr:hypothetical protein [Deltaproteobacteria bacterium]MBW2536182.1 hypothetical protein [Deltaproteobacteria bacterium]